MKQTVSPVAFASIIVAALVVVGLIMWRVWLAPSATRDANAPKEMVKPGPPDYNAINRAKQDWQRQHPESAAPGGR